jgi:steroid Delta-isomerase
MSELNLATVWRFWDSINNRDVEAYLATFAEDAVAYDPADKPPLQTDDERRQFMDELLSSFSEIQARIDFITPCGKSSAAKWTVTGRSTSGEAVHIEGIDTYEHTADGRLKEMRGYFKM